MAFKSPEINGARQDIGGLKSPEINGARQDIGSLKKYVEGAWQDVWASVKLMTLEKYSSNSCVISQSEYGDATTIYTFDTNSESEQTIVYVANGNFSNPTMTFTWQGDSNPAESQDYIVGYLCAYGVDASGNVTTVASNGGTLYNSSEAVKIRYGNSGTEELSLTGEFVKFGFKWVGGYDDCDDYNMVHISNIQIDGQKYITDSSYDYDNTSN